MQVTVVRTKVVICLDFLDGKGKCSRTSFRKLDGRLVCCGRRCIDAKTASFINAVNYKNADEPSNRGTNFTSSWTERPGTWRERPLV